MFQIRYTHTPISLVFIPPLSGPVLLKLLVVCMYSYLCVCLCFVLVNCLFNPFATRVVWWLFSFWKWLYCSEVCDTLVGVSVLLFCIRDYLTYVAISVWVWECWVCVHITSEYWSVQYLCLFCCSLLHVDDVVHGLSQPFVKVSVRLKSHAHVWLLTILGLYIRWLSSIEPMLLFWLYFHLFPIWSYVFSKMTTCQTQHIS